MTDVVAFLLRLNSILISEEPLSPEVLCASLQATSPKHVISATESISLLGCTLPEFQLNVSIINQFGSQRSLFVLLDDNKAVICDNWPIIGGVAPTFQESRAAPRGQNALYRGYGDSAAIVMRRLTLLLAFSALSPPEFA